MDNRQDSHSDIFLCVFAQEDVKENSFGIRLLYELHLSVCAQKRSITLGFKLKRLKSSEMTNFLEEAA